MHDNKHLFILCMNNSGSTMLHSYLSKCNRVIQLPKKHGLEHITTSFEGHLLAKDYMPTPNDLGVIAVFSKMQHVFEDSDNYNWDKIKEMWTGLWRKSSSWGESDKVLLEKSPPDLLRADLLNENFPNSNFIVMVRDPYAVIEGMNRRYGHSLVSGAEHWCRTASRNIYNIRNIEKITYFTYEQLCDNADFVKSKILSILPELEDINFDQKTSGVHSVDGRGEKSLVNFNKKQVSRFDDRHFSLINSVLMRNLNILNFFGYKIINASSEYSKL